ncbi:MAG: hypothetical protein H7318_00930 [Oligoflexus sp.]|nr:hypothetical protein [Oligoflexus sp.]
MIGKLPKISKKLAAASLLSRALLLCMIIAGVSCRSPQATDLSAEAPQGYSFDLPGLSDTPPEDEDFTPRLSIPSNIEQNSKVWLKYSLPADTHMDRLLARNCTNVLAIFQGESKIISGDNIEQGTSAFAFATLPSIKRPSQLYLQVKLSEHRRFDLSCKSLQLTSLNNAIWYYIVSSSPLVISGVLISFVGTLSLVLNFVVFSWTLLFFGAHALLIGLYLLSGIDLTNMMAIDASPYRTSAAFLTLITYLLFFEEFIGSRRHLARIFAGLNALVCLGFQICQTLSPQVYADKLAPNILTVAMLNMMVTLLLVFEAAAKQKPFARAMAFAAAFISLFVGLDIYNHSQSQISLFVSPWIFLFVICLTLVVLIYKSIAEQSKTEQVRTVNAKKRNLELQSEVDRRTEALSDQAKELELIHERLEERVEILTRQKSQASEVAKEKDDLLLHITEIKKVLIPRIVSRLQKLHDEPSANDASDVVRQLDELLKVFSQATISTPEEKSKANEVIDVLSANKRYQRTFKSSIGGARLDLRMTESVEALLENGKGSPSRLIVIEDSFVEQLPAIHESNPKASLVAFSEKGMSSATQYLIQYPMLDQVLTLDLPKPILQKILLTHLMKLISQDVFGIEKYLMWGSAVKERPLDMRAHSADQWEGLRLDIEQAGLSQELERKVSILAENLLEIRRGNLISSGQNDAQKLKQLRYGHDAHVFCLSVDLSGHILARQEIIRFFQSTPDSHPIAIQLFEESHAIILNSNGHDKHELILLLFQSNEEIPPAYFYSFISS